VPEPTVESQKAKRVEVGKLTSGRDKYSPFFVYSDSFGG